MRRRVEDRPDALRNIQGNWFSRAEFSLPVALRSAPARHPATREPLQREGPSARRSRTDDCPATRFRASRREIGEARALSAESYADRTRRARRPHPIPHGRSCGSPGRPLDLGADKRLASRTSSRNRNQHADDGRSRLIELSRAATNRPTVDRAELPRLETSIAVVPARICRLDRPSSGVGWLSLIRS